MTLDHVRFIESHEAPSQTSDVESIARDADLTPILFDSGEEEESLPVDLRKPIPDDPLVPPGRPDDPTVGQPNQDNNPVEPQRLNRQGQGVKGEEKRTK